MPGPTYQFDEVREGDPVAGNRIFYSLEVSDLEEAYDDMVEEEGAWKKLTPERRKELVEAIDDGINANTPWDWKSYMQGELENHEVEYGVVEGSEGGEGSQE